MASPPPGWYDDPARSGRLRYWDGQAWTDRLADRPAHAADQGGPSVPQPSVPQHGEPQPGQAQPAPPGQVRRHAVPRGRRAADGTPLAPWWRRLLAWIIDQAICTVLALPATAAILAVRWDTLQQWSDAVQAAAARGGELPTAPAELVSAMAAAGVVGTLLYFLYELIGLTRFGTTWGRRLLGIRVRVPGAAGPMSVQAASRRSAIKVAGQIAGGSAALANMGFFFTLFDLGRGLMDRDRRTLHDLGGGTDVILHDGRGDTPRR